MAPIRPHARSLRWAAVVLLVLASVAQLGQTRPVLAEVQALTGGFQHATSDFNGLNNSGLSFRRTYNSLDATGSSLGPGWSHSFGARLIRPDGPDGDGSGDFLFVGPRGEQQRFSAQPDGTWQPSATAQGTLRKETAPVIGEHYVLTQPFETVYYFLPNGWLYRTTFAQTWDLLLAYDRDGRLRTVMNRKLGVAAPVRLR